MKMWIVVSLVLQFIIRLRFPPNKSIASIVTARYGKPTLRLIRKFENADFKLRKAALDIEFIERSIKHELIPKFVQFKVANKGLRGSKAYKQCQNSNISINTAINEKILWKFTYKYALLLTIKCFSSSNIHFRIYSS